MGVLFIPAFASQLSLLSEKIRSNAAILINSESGAEANQAEKNGSSLLPGSSAAADARMCCGIDHKIQS